MFFSLRFFFFTAVPQTGFPQQIRFLPSGFTGGPAACNNRLAARQQKAHAHARRTPTGCVDSGDPLRGLLLLLFYYYYHYTLCVHAKSDLCITHTHTRELSAATYTQTVCSPPTVLFTIQLRRTPCVHNNNVMASARTCISAPCSGHSGSHVSPSGLVTLPTRPDGKATRFSRS